MSSPISKCSIACVLILSAFTARAQVYICADAGYHLPAASQLMSYDANGAQGGTAYTVKQGSFGSGINAGIGAGCMFGSFGAEIKASYLISKKYTTTSHFDNGQGTTSDLDESRRATMIRITPAILLVSKGERIRPYIKAGMIIGVAGKITRETSSISSDLSGSTSIENTFELGGGTSLGYTGSMGLQYAAGRLSLYAEAVFIGQSWAPTKGKYTSFTINGQDQLAGMTTSEKEEAYLDSVDSSTQSTNEPTKKLKTNEHFSGAGINAGVIISIGKSKQ